MNYPNFLESIFTNPKYFKLLGFNIVRNALTEEEVKRFRDSFPSIFEEESSGCRMLLPREILKKRELFLLPFRKKIVIALKKSFGDNYVQWGDFQLQRNCFGGWHADAGSEDNAQYLMKKDYAFAKCGIYFQENTKRFGGGIGIRFFSHQMNYGRPEILRLLKAKFYRFFDNAMSHDVRINAGDFVFFDSRLMHTSTLPEGVTLSHLDNRGVYNLNKEVSKYVFYWNACSENSWKGFMYNSAVRSYTQEVIPGAEEIFFTDYCSRRYPDDYPKEFVDKICENGLNVATPNQRLAEISKELLQRELLQKRSNII